MMLLVSYLERASRWYLIKEYIGLFILAGITVIGILWIIVIFIIEYIEDKKRNRRK